MMGKASVGSPYQIAMMGKASAVLYSARELYTICQMLADDPMSTPPPTQVWGRWGLDGDLTSQMMNFPRMGTK